MKFSGYAATAARHVLVYGPPKAGKTSLVGALAEHYKLWYFDLEDSIKTLLQPSILKPEFRDNIELFKLPDKQNFPIGIETVLKIIKGGLCNVCEQHGKVDCPACKKENKPFTAIDVNKLEVEKDIVIIESYSQLAESAINYIMREAIAKDNFDAKMEWSDWAKQGKILERIGSTIQTAPFNVIVTTHEQLVEMEDGTKRIVPIGGTSNASKVFAKYFDDVVYVEVFNKSHRVISSTTGKSSVLAGSRTGIDLKPGDGLIKLFRSEG